MSAFLDALKSEGLTRCDWTATPLSIVGSTSDSPTPTNENTEPVREGEPIREAEARINRAWNRIVPQVLPKYIGLLNTEDDFAEVIATIIQGEVFYRPHVDEFHLRDFSQYYKRDAEGVVRHIILLVARRAFDLLEEYQGDPRGPERVLKRVRSKYGSDSIYSLIKNNPLLIRTENEINPPGFIMTPDGPRSPLSCKTGAPAGTVFTQKTNYAPDFENDPGEFLQFVESLFPGNDDERNDTKNIVSRMLDHYAIAISGKANQIEKGNIYTGPGGSGKNQIVECIEAVIGSYFGWVKPETIYETMSAGDVPRSDLFALGEYLIACVNEPSDKMLSGSLVKTIISGEPLPARRQHGRTIVNIRPKGLFIILSNRKPYMPHDSGTGRRIENYEFVQNFWQSANRIDDIGRKIGEAEGPQILGHLMKRAKDWNDRGGRLVDLAQSITVDEWTRNYLGWSDTIGRFIDDELERTLLSEVKVTLMLERHKAWAEKNGEHTMSARALGEALYERGINRKRKNSGIYFEGVKLK